MQMHEVSERDFSDLQPHIDLIDLALGDMALLFLVRSFSPQTGKKESDPRPIDPESFNSFASFWSFLKTTLVTGWEQPVDVRSKEYQSAAQLFHTLRDGLIGASQFVSKQVEKGIIVAPIGSALNSK